MPAATFRLSRNRFYTLPELLIVMSVLSVLSLIAMPSLKSVRSRAWLVSCMSNLRQLTAASALYQVQHKEFPPQPISDKNPLPVSLAEFVRDPKVFRCQMDRRESTDSYSPFYVKRTTRDAGDAFLLGCPRHDGGTIAANVFQKGSATAHPVGPMYHTKGSKTTRAYPGDSVGSGTTWFPDGSTVTILTPALKAEIIESFRLETGQTYTLIKVPTNNAFGQLIIDVLPGSKFEVVTPAAVSGVRGTVFLIDIFPLADGRKAIDVFVYEGRVAVTELSGRGDRMASWGVPIRCEEGVPPYLSLVNPPPLPGIGLPPLGLPPLIPSGTPPWVMGMCPWPNGVAPWAPGGN